MVTKSNSRQFSAELEEEELNEDFHEQELSNYVSQVIRYLEKEDVKVPDHCHKFIERCLRVKNYDVRKASNLFRNFGIMMNMSEMQDLYAKFQPSKLKDLYLKGTIAPAFHRDCLGRLVVVGHAGSWNPEEFDFDDALAAFIVMVNYASAQSPSIQRKGLVFLLDFGGWSLQQIRSVKFGRLKTVAKLMQNSSPGKIKGIHIIRYPRIIAVLFALIKPFLKFKLTSRVHFHGELESLNKIDPNLLDAIPDKRTSGCYNHSSNFSRNVDEQLVSDVIQSDKYCNEMVKLYYPPY